MEVRQTIPNRWCIKVSLRDGFCWPRSVYEWRNDITNRGEWASSGYLNHNGVYYLKLVLMHNYRRVRS